MENLPLSFAMRPEDFAGQANAALFVCIGVSHFPKGMPLLLTDEGCPLLPDPASVCEKIKTAPWVLLDFEQCASPEVIRWAADFAACAPCPVAVAQVLADHRSGPVFLPPPPLDMPLSEYLRPFREREVWLEASLQAITIVLSARGTEVSQGQPTGEAIYDPELACMYHAEASPDALRFTLFDTKQTLRQKAQLALELGVKRILCFDHELR